MFKLIGLALDNKIQSRATKKTKLLHNNNNSSSNSELYLHGYNNTALQKRGCSKNLAPGCDWLISLSTIGLDFRPCEIHRPIFFG